MQPLKLCMFASICQRSTIVTGQFDLDGIHVHFQVIVQCSLPWHMHVYVFSDMKG